MHELEARPHPDGALRWIVTSRSRPEIEHLVDLDSYAGIGHCSCEHFQFRIEPDLREGRRRQGGTRCSHILVARNAFTDAMIQTIATIKARRAGATACQYCGNPGPTDTCPGCQSEIDNASEP